MMGFLTNQEIQTPVPTTTVTTVHFVRAFLVPFEQTRHCRFLTAQVPGIALHFMRNCVRFQHKSRSQNDSLPDPSAAETKRLEQNWSPLVKGGTAVLRLRCKTVRMHSRGRRYQGTGCDLIPDWHRSREPDCCSGFLIWFIVSLASSVA